MTHNVSSDSIRAAIKALLRKREMSYADLARELSVSLSTVKRVLTTEDISLDRLFRLCEVLGAAPEEIFGMARECQKKELRYTAEEDAFFADHPSHFRYHSLLLEGKRPGQIALRHKLSRLESSRYLNDLERAGLLHRTPQGQVRLKYSGMHPQWAAHGRLQQLYLHRILSRVTAHLSDRIRGFEKCPPKEKPLLALSMTITRIRPATLSRFIEEAEELFERFRKMARIEEGLAGDVETTPVVFGVLGDAHESIGAWNEEIWPALGSP